MGRSTWAIRAQTSGSWSRTHTSFGAVNPVSASLPVISISRSGPTAARMASHSAAVRWSFHRIAGRRTSPAASSRTSPCIWPVSPTADDLGPGDARRREGRAGSRPMRAVPPQRAGPARSTAVAARRSRTRTSRSPTTAPVSSTRTALVAVVETSMPRTRPIVRPRSARSTAQIRWLTRFSRRSWRPDDRPRVDRAVGDPRLEVGEASEPSRIARARASPSQPA